MSRLYRFALATVIATLGLVAVGSLARLQPAGAGCGNDWPRCNGSWLPPLGWAPLIEYAHRAAALAVILLAVATLIVAYRSPASRRVRALASAGLGAILLQSLIGGATAIWGAPANIAILHLAVAMLFLAFSVAALVAVAATGEGPAWLADLGRAPSPEADRAFAIAASASAVVAFGLVIFGASTSATGAFACATWPLCGGTGSVASAETTIHLGYRATALLGAFAAAATGLLAWRRDATRGARALAIAAIALVVLQSALNGIATVAGDPAWMSSPHLLVATLIWLALFAVALAAWGPRPEAARYPYPGIATAMTGSATAESSPAPVVAPAVPAPAGALAPLAPVFELDLTVPSLQRARQIVADYVALTKPGIMMLLLTTTLCAMLMAERGLPPFWLVALTMLGGALASGGASVLNCYIDRDIDGQMSRTRNRAIVAGRISADAALAYGIALSAASVLLLGLLVNWTAALLALAGNLYYVFVYTMWLKRSTPYNIVIGGAAGAVPPLVGWAAVTGNAPLLAWGLFAIIFAWTPPHSWALALLKQGEYTRAAVPMLPVVRGEAETRRQIVIYTAILMAVCLALAAFGLGILYLAAAIVLNGLFLGLAIRLYRVPSKRAARQLFFYSLWYLALIFSAGVVDRILLG
ncbi:MAG: protoheme IX farnesyltransferase [Thermomicrobiales bacterium]|nr:protoheme IX farnesyltransferase [Thermomicrobiales bacterium]